MKNLLLILVIMSSLSVWAQVTISQQDAELIISKVHYDGLGARFHIPLSEANAECISLTNYDNKVGFDCILRNKTDEVDVSVGNLQSIIRATSGNISDEWGWSTRFGRSKVHCKSNKKCSFSKTLTLEEEKHRYCFMTVHSTYGGRLVFKSVTDERVIIDSLKCNAYQTRDFVGNLHTRVDASIVVNGNIGSILGIDTFNFGMSFEGHVDQNEACTEINKKFKVNNELLVEVEREVVQSEQTSIKNSNKQLFEKATLLLADGTYLRGSVKKEIVKGKYCADFKN